MSTLTENLLAYALGRSLEHYDAAGCPVRSCAKLGAERLSFLSLVLGIVNSMPFQMRSEAETATYSGGRHDRSPRSHCPGRTFLRGYGRDAGVAVSRRHGPGAPSWRDAGQAGPADSGSSTSPTARFSRCGCRPRRAGGFELSPILSPLAPVRDQVTVLSGLAHHGRPIHFGDGNGDHAARHRGVADRRARVRSRSQRRRRRQSGDDRRSDRRAAQLGKDTRLPSLELALEKPDPDRLRQRGLLLLEHDLVADADDAAARWNRTRGSSSSGCSAMAARAAQRLRADAQDGQHSRFGHSGSGRSAADARLERSHEAERVSRGRARDRAAHPEHRGARRRSRRWRCRTARPTFRRRSKSTPR